MKSGYSPSIPSLLKKSGRKLEDAILEIQKLVDGPISAEVSEGNEEQMYNQAHHIVEIANNDRITIKLPMTEDGIKVCKRLSNEGIKTNVTLIFTLNQALLAMEAGATFISPFMGRLDDYAQNKEAGFNLINEINKVKKIYGYDSKIIAASIRNTKHIEQAMLAGADICTIPYKIIKEMYLHELTTKGLEAFKNDERKI